jgi:cytochrome P450
MNEFDPTTGEARRDPHTMFRELRANCPVAHSDAFGGFWAVTRWSDIEAVVTNPEVFSSRHGIIVPRNPASGRRPPMHYDPPEHTRYRKAINPPFRKDRLDWLEPRLREEAARLVTAAVAAGRVDAFAELASPLCARSVTALLGLPDHLAGPMGEHAAAFELAQFDFDARRVEEENLLLYEWCREVVADRRQHPRSPDTDIVCGLMEAADDDEIAAGGLRQILVAGHGAPALVMTAAIGHLAGDADLQDHLRADPTLVPAAVEELLRLHTPNLGFARTVTRDVEVGGRTIPAGDVVTIPYTSANRDERVYERPDEVVLDRPPPRATAGVSARHLAFGHGVHVCPGAHVGRVQTRVVLEELLARTSGFTLAGEPEYAPFPVHGPRSLPLQLEPLP